MGRVKKGSALLNVLIIAMILTMTAGVITTAVVQTTKGNVNKKVTDDLTYAAESGVQQAISNIDDLKYKTLALGATTTFNIDAKFINQEIKVNVEVKKNMDNATYNVTSVATKIVDGVTRDRTVKAKIKKSYSGSYGTDNLFKYSLCGKNTYIYHTGDFDPRTALVNGSESVYTANAAGMSYIKPPSNNKVFHTPKFDKINYLDEVIIINNETDLNNKSGTLSEVQRGTKKIVKEEFETIGFEGAIKRKIDVYMVNAKNIVIQNIGSATLTNKIIICSGNVTVINSADLPKIQQSGLPPKDPLDPNKYLAPTLTPPIGTLHFVNSSIIGENVSLYVSTINLGTAIYTEASATNPGPINYEVDLNRLNELVRKYDSTWAGSELIEGTESWSETEVTYE